MGYRELYLFPDRQYASLDHVDIGDTYSQGTWSLQDGVLTLDPHAWFEGQKLPKRWTQSLVAVTVDGKRRQAIVNDYHAEQLPLMPKASDEKFLTERFTGIFLCRQDDIPDSKAIAIHDELDADFGKYSFDGLAERFNPTFSRGGREDSGWFVVYAENATHLASIRLKGVTIQAQQIAFSPKLDVIKFSGSVSASGGPVPHTDGLTLYFDGNKMPEPSGR